MSIFSSSLASGDFSLQVVSAVSLQLRSRGLRLRVFVVQPHNKSSACNVRRMPLPRTWLSREFSTSASLCSSPIWTVQRRNLE
ncbi:hypothetical protein BU25DRAFT_415747 [Macroventuria anomochaeta]|uniref:Uncharacterized protein n=1 Tax=Macroventuria anomochaeta TaxID=301207 RepID=A0ACB6RJA5_9PLEO|nr:uncharacterized protein BU25DRAFT_415747 [Macroventuria anomochaeta]KAF2621903.1 hypothetical protein BU25DRAFT_415747 [Macroventuria anomochaeta]